MVDHSGGQAIDYWKLSLQVSNFQNRAIEAPRPALLLRDLPQAFWCGLFFRCPGCTRQIRNYIWSRTVNFLRVQTGKIAILLRSLLQSSVCHHAQ